MVVVTPRSWPLICIDVCIMSYMVAFSLASLSHCAIMWHLRKEFAMGVRSPVLAIVSGVAALFVTNLAVVGRTLDYDRDISTEMLFFLPLSLTFTAAYILRGIRLLAFYSPAPTNRQRRIKYLNEWFFARILLIVYLATEGAVWAFVPNYGKITVARQMKFVAILDMALSIAASAALYRKIRETHDIFNMSKEILTVGWFLMAALGVGVVFVVVLARGLLDGKLFHVANFLFLAVRFHTAVWHTNIRPVREILRGNAGQQEGEVPWLPFVPLCMNSSRTAAIALVEDNAAVASRSLALASKCEELRPLEHIMNYPPLLRAFADFCQMALCCELLMFLREVATFRNLSEKGADEGLCFEMFIAIMNEFVQTGSTFEVNISDDAKAKIVGCSDEAIFKGLDKETRVSAFAAAEEEISQVLIHNLLGIFRTTEVYQTLARDLRAMSSDRRGE